jgi:hypothetical protein
MGGWVNTDTCRAGLLNISDEATAFHASSQPLAARTLCMSARIAGGLTRGSHSQSRSGEMLGWFKYRARQQSGTPAGTTFSLQQLDSDSARREQQQS